MEVRVVTQLNSLIWDRNWRISYKDLYKDSESHFQEIYDVIKANISGIFPMFPFNAANDEPYKFIVTVDGKKIKTTLIPRDSTQEQILAILKITRALIIVNIIKNDKFINAKSLSLIAEELNLTDEQIDNNDKMNVDDYLMLLSDLRYLKCLI